MLELPELKNKAAKIKLIALDVDGVLTDGSIIYSSSGEELKCFNIKDGLGLANCIEKGIFTAIITSRKSPALEKRAKELHFTHMYQGIADKTKTLKELTEIHHISYEQIAYMGDDVIDIPALKIAGLACCPQDAVDEVKEICDFISKKEGGKGAVRELTDLILKIRLQLETR